jgi:drug/metabolite transporter (DMT)-like permease
VLGAFLALLSAVTFALNNASVRRGVVTASVLQGMAITVPFGVPLFLLAAAAIGTLGAITSFSLEAILALSAAGILHFVWGRYCNYRAMGAIGTNLASPVQQINLIVTLVLAIWVLGETLTLLRILGIALILLGPSVMLREASEGGKGAAARAGSARETFQPRYAEGYTFALLSATGYGLSPVFVRLGLEGRSLGTSIAGGLVAYLAATAVMGLVLLWPGNLRQARAVNVESAKWFTLSGITVCVSQMFFYMALSLAPVTVVSPINRLTIVFRLYFSRLLNPHHEVFGGRVILGTAISLAGALVISLGADMVAPLLPSALTPLLEWHWP